MSWSSGLGPLPKNGCQIRAECALIRASVTACGVTGTREIMLAARGEDGTCPAEQTGESPTRCTSRLSRRSSTEAGCAEPKETGPSPPVGTATYGQDLPYREVEPGYEN